jgi:hypothetical protein
LAARTTRCETSEGNAFSVAGAGQGTAVSGRAAVSCGGHRTAVIVMGIVAENCGAGVAVVIHACTS